jgi:hypothetical protein
VKFSDEKFFWFSTRAENCGLDFLNEKTAHFSKFTQTRKFGMLFAVRDFLGFGKIGGQMKKTNEFK